MVIRRDIYICMYFFNYFFSPKRLMCRVVEGLRHNSVIKASLLSVSSSPCSCFTPAVAARSYELLKAKPCFLAVIESLTGVGWKGC